MHSTNKKQRKEKKGITRREMLRATFGSAASIPLFLHSVRDTHAGLPFNTRKDKAIRLNLNENPFGPSPRAMLAAMENLHRSNLYAYPAIEKLYGALMHHNDLNKDLIVLGTGSWEIQRLAALANFDYGGNIVTTRQTYKIFLDFAENLGFTIKKVDHIVDTQGNWRYDIEGLLEAVDSQTRLLYLVNPNNPTGAWLDYQQLKYLADSLPPTVLLLLDEAYIQFLVNIQKNGIDMIKEGYKNVLVTRTFSKVYGLAGLRTGYGVSHPDVIEYLQKFSTDFLSINTSGFYGAIAALNDTRFVAKSIRQAHKTLAFYKEGLTALGLDYVIGEGPFVMVDVNNDAELIVKKMAEKNVLVAGGEEWEMPTYIRISYGTNKENQRAIDTLQSIIPG